MFSIVGIGIKKENLTLEAIEEIKRADFIYLEGYTSFWDKETIKFIEKLSGKKVIILNREEVEQKFEFKGYTVLLVPGDPLFATTHHSLILEAIKKKIPYKIIHNISIINLIGRTGLHHYKFGKISSLPKWEKNYKPTSFYNVILDNLKIKAHTLILVDPKLNWKEAIKELEEVDKNNLFKEKFIALSNLGRQKEKIIWGNLNFMRKFELDHPFSFIYPSELHFTEKEFLGAISICQQ